MKGDACEVRAAITFDFDAQEPPPGFVPQTDLEFDLLSAATSNNSESIKALLDHVEPNPFPQMEVLISFLAGRVFPAIRDRGQKLKSKPGCTGAIFTLESS